MLGKKCKHYYRVLFAAYKLELALAISFVSFGSSQILFLPHFITAAASRFCNRMVLHTDTTTNNITGVIQQQ